MEPNDPHALTVRCHSPLFTLLYILRIEIYLDLLFSDIKPVQGLFINSLFWLATLPNSPHF